MRIILRRRVIPDSQNPEPQYRQLTFKVGRLTVGRAADQHVHIEHPDVAEKHAILYMAHGRLRVRALGAAALQVNGQACRNVHVGVGDVVTFGISRLTIEQHRSDGVVVLRLNDPYALSTTKVDARDALSLKGTGISSRPWSWLLVLTVLALGFVAPLAAALVHTVRPVVRSVPAVPSDVLWQPGPLHARHRAIGNDCNKCHTTPFQRVQNEACETCHRDVHQHISASSSGAQRFTGALCADCHAEHDAQKELVDRHSDGCVVCHSKLKAAAPETKLHDVADFSLSHPEFALTMLEPVGTAVPSSGIAVAVPAALRGSAKQESNLAFSHKVHLDRKGIASPEGSRQLECSSCHQSDAGGRFMLPIRMETHCAECHTLQFDEHDTASKVPHGDLKLVFKALREHFSRAFLDQNLAQSRSPDGRRRPGAEQAVLSREEQRRALAWADTQTSLAARELLEKRVCVECHKVERIGSQASTAEDWKIAPVQLTGRWFPRASFNHAAHKTSACESCHQHVETSDESAAVHMPTIANCRSCHGEGEPRKVPSTCLTCHEFHRPENAPFIDAGPAAPLVTAQ